MYQSGKPYPRLLPQFLLSPIDESEEEGPHIYSKFTKSESNITELNNSSIISREISKTSGLRKELRFGENDRFSTGKTFIESCSGRKHEDVEVIKQKYINSEIQDLPRIVRGPFRYGHIHRTRSTHLNLGSQDIRNQMNKIRLKARTSLTNVTTEKQQEFRYKKFSEPNEQYLKLQKSVEEVLYGDYNPDDYDPELATLFENYIEECDNRTKTREEPAKYLSPYPTECDTKEESEKISDRQLDLDTEHAFLCGYIEGLKHTDQLLNADEYDKCMHGNNVLEDTLSGVLNHRDLISSQQDITHLSLREWEQNYRSELQERENERQNITKMCLTSDKQDKHDKQPSHEARDTQENDNQSKEIPGRSDGPDTAPYNADLEIGDNQTGDAKDSRENAPSVDHVVSGIRRQADKMTTIDEPLSTKHSLREQRSSKHLVDLVQSSPVMKAKRISDFGTEPKSTSALPSSKIEENIIKHAKQKLENRLMTSGALEESYLSKPKVRLITNDCKPHMSTKSKTEQRGAKTSISKVQANGNQIGTNILDELDGWNTKSKAFNDQDNVQLSSSELLHPRDSYESIFSPMWTPSSSTPLLTPADQEFLEEQESYTKSPTWKPSTSAISTSLNATLSDLEYKCIGYKTNDKANSQSRLVVSDNYKNAANLVKLRLTNSLPTNERHFVDRSFANVPLSQCVNYSIEQNMRTDVQLTTHINLSEKLAQQLKELSATSKRGGIRHQEGICQEHSGEAFMTQTSSNDYKPEKKSSFSDVVEHTETNTEKKSSAFSSSHGPFSSENTRKMKSPIPRQKGKDHNTTDQNKSESLDLPPISVSSFPTRNIQKGCNKVVKTHDNEPSSYHGNRGTAVRAGVCTSPYEFNKEDPRMLQLKARSLPSFHSVCTSCGGISENVEKTDKLDRKAKDNGVESDTKSKQIHLRCCGSCFDDKWKMDKGRVGPNVAFPAVGVESLETRRRQQNSQPDVKTVPKIVVSPTSTKTKCEELSIQFMNKNIKFRFQCDINDDTPRQDADQTCSTNEWLSNISAPINKERFQCPVAAETRIYRKGLKKSCNIRTSTPQTPVSSPYIDYCKHKSELQKKRKEKMKDRIEFISDTCLTDEVYLKAESKGKKFPIIPIKKRKDRAKGLHKYAKTITSTNGCIFGKKSDVDLLVESTKPARLPYIKKDPFIFSRDNVNNNHGRTTDKLYTVTFISSLAFGLSTSLLFSC